MRRAGAVARTAPASGSRSQPAAASCGPEGRGRLPGSHVDDATPLLWFLII